MQSDSKLNRTDLAITYIGGPTALLEWNGLRLLTDPTFDPAGTDYPTNGYTLKRREGPAISVEKMGDIDAVPLSHDHHYDNLDHAGRKMLAGTRKVLTTIEGAARLGQDAAGLENWQSVDVSNPNGRI